jgi:hypothetical protein
MGRKLALWPTPRRAVADPKFVDDVDWSDVVIETVETAEHALVSKTARIDPEETDAASVSLPQSCRREGIRST